MKRPALFALLFAALSACGGSPAPIVTAKPTARPQPSSSAAVASVDPEPWRQQKPAPSKAGTLNLPVPEQVTLPSGLTLLIVKKPVPVASISLVIRHGGGACPPGKSGLAALTTRLLTEGTKRHPALKLHEEVEQLGTVLSDDTGRDSSDVSLSALTADVDHAIQLLGEVVTEPAFAPKDFERVQKEWLDDLRDERQSPDRLASLAALNAALGKPHGSPVKGSLVDVAKLTVKDVVDFHRKAYGAPDAALIVVGDVTLASVQASATRAFAKLGKGEHNLEQPFSAPAQAPKNRILLVDRPGAVQSVLMLIQPGPARSAPGYEARQLLSTLFGGMFTSRLNLNLREEHAYTYGAHAHTIANVQWGGFYLTTSVRTDVTADAMKEALKELAQLRDPKLGKPINTAELGRARAGLVQSVGASLEHGARIANTLSELWLYNLPLNYLQTYPDLLAQQTPDSLTNLANDIDVAHLTVVVVGDRAQIEKPLQALGYAVTLAPADLTE